VVATLPVDVIGTATDADFLRYVLEYSPAGKGEWVRFAEGSAAVTDGVLGQFDPTLLNNGLYDVRLTAWDKAGNTATATKVFQADGQAKLGNFTVAFDDLSIP